MFLIATCGLFINMQLIVKLLIYGEYSVSNAQQIASNGEYYAQTWFLSMIIAFVGSLLIGLVARLPLVQVSGLGLSTVLVSFVGIETGLTYYNLLFVCFVSSIVYTALVAVPGVKQFIFRALPQPVRRALPAAAGLLLAWIGIQLSGIVTIQDSRISIYGAGEKLEAVRDNVAMFGGVGIDNYSSTYDFYHPLMLLAVIAVLVTFVAYLIFRQRTKRPFFFSFITGTLFYLLSMILIVVVDWKIRSFNLDSLWGRLWMVGSEDAMQCHLSRMFASFKIGNIFTRGTDFSAYIAAGGSVPFLFAVSILNFVMLFLCDAQSALQSVSENSGVFDADDQKQTQLALICNGVMNIVAPLIGACPTGIGKASVAGSKDGAKSGLSSVVASLGFLISIFVWVVPFLCATGFSYDIVFNLYGHYGTVLQMFSQTAFVVADAVMVLIGLSMIAGCLNIDWKDFTIAAPFAATVAGTILLSNLACGAALGSIVYVIAKVTEKKNEESEKNAGLSLPVLVWTAVSVIFLILMIVK
jgi:xanthine/uracil/vitamin C permease (AzgA family)